MQLIQLTFHSVGGNRLAVLTKNVPLLLLSCLSCIEKHLDAIFKASCGLGNAVKHSKFIPKIKPHPRGQMQCYCICPPFVLHFIGTVCRILPHGSEIVGKSDLFVYTVADQLFRLDGS